MTDNPFQAPLGDNPYLPPQHAARDDSSNPLLIPAIFLLILASCHLLLLILIVPMQVLQLSRIDTATPDGAGRFMGQLTAMVVWSLFMLAIIIGSVCMLRLKSHRSALIASILGVIPLCSPCYVLGIPFAIWALVLLLRSDVKARFS